MGRIIPGVMTPQEHTLNILLLARVNQYFIAITEILKSREIITGDDLKAFNYAAWDDNRQLLAAIAQARGLSKDSQASGCGSSARNLAAFSIQSICCSVRVSSFSSCPATAPPLY